MADAELRGADQFVVLAKRLKEAGDKGLQRELTKALKTAVEPLQREVRQRALGTLPKRGGLNRLVADRVVPRVQQRASGNSTGIRVRATGKDGLKGLVNLDKGFVRHPVFANQRKTRDEWHWVTQQIAPRFWSDPAEKVAPEVRAQLQAALERVAKQIEGKL